MTNKYYSKKVYTELACTEPVESVECGFTIIELLIVMAIIGVLMPLGINAFVNTRRSREVSEAAANARDAIKNARAMALSISSPSGLTDWPVAYHVEFFAESVVTTVKFVSAEKQHSDWDSNYQYSYQSELVSNLDLGNVSVNPLGCYSVVFSSVNGNMYIYDSDEKEVSDCGVEFSLGGKTRNLVLNSVSKTFEIQ